MMTCEDLEDAQFRLKDRAWAVLVGFIDEHHITSKTLSERTGLPQVCFDEVMKTPSLMTMEMFGVIAAALDCDFNISLASR